MRPPHGSTHTVDAEHLLGMAPDADHYVQSGSLRSIPVDDHRGAISRVHAEPRVRGRDVVVSAETALPPSGMISVLGDSATDLSARYRRR